MAGGPSTSEPASGDSVWDEATKTKFNNKMYSQYFDPCQEAASKSLKCLHRNGGDKDLCEDYFQAYKDCKKQWMTEMKQAKQKGAK